MLEVRDLCAWYGRTQALFGVTFSLRRGECLALVGTNGAGKTTTIRAVLGLIRTSGSIAIEGAAVEGLTTARRVRRYGIAVVHEGRGLLKRLTVFENIVVGLPRAAHGRVDEALDLFPALRGRLKEPVSLLSGGQQQMVALARAVVERPRLLLLDEPSLGLAPVIVEEIYGYLGKLREAGLTMLLVEQSIARARDFADALCLIRIGQSVETVPSSDPERVADLVRLTFAESRNEPGTGVPLEAEGR
jgi:branched-chain amino acid transport system ATP-binding protein